MTIYDQILLSVFALTVLFLVNEARKSYTRTRPPGPRGWPIVGNAFQMPASQQWLTFTEWAAKYGGDLMNFCWYIDSSDRKLGDVVYVSALGTPMIIVSSPKALFELGDKRGGIYNNRPQLPMSGEM